jgi:hypothetical protein
LVCVEIVLGLKAATITLACWHKVVAPIYGCVGAESYHEDTLLRTANEPIVLPDIGRELDRLIRALSLDMCLKTTFQSA